MKDLTRLKLIKMLCKDIAEEATALEKSISDDKKLDKANLHQHISRLDTGVEELRQHWTQYGTKPPV